MIYTFSYPNLHIYPQTKNPTNVGLDGVDSSLQFTLINFLYNKINDSIISPKPINPIGRFPLSRIKINDTPSTNIRVLIKIEYVKFSLLNHSCTLS